MEVPLYNQIIPNVLRKLYVHHIQQVNLQFVTM
jgi:hypothetical protein